MKLPSMFQLMAQDWFVKKEEKRPDWMGWALYLGVKEDKKTLEKKYKEFCKREHLLGNEINGEDESTDIIFDILEIWDDGDESITLFLTNKKIDYERVEREEEERIEDIVDFELQEEEEEREWLKRVSLYKQKEKKK